ncbi:hypothetical protein ONS96_013190 [Cadophora gregata f. sp. sojae]|nr:hypothetical protein ONS96_013190 [Cadophora gregata f. sp. sojae]
MPLAYIPRSLANTVRSEPVTAIYLCASAPTEVAAPLEPGASISGKMTNHWVMYLAASSTRSICFDPSPTGPGNSIDLIITSKNISHINSAVKSMYLTTTADLKIGNVLDHITNCKYDKYTFSAGGQGCRFWLYSVVESLSSAGYITDSSEADAAKEALGIVWDIEEGRVPAVQQTGMTKGTF